MCSQEMVKITCYYPGARNQAESACRSAVKNLEKNMAQNVKKIPKALFAYFGTTTRTQDGVAEWKDVERNVSSDKGEANILNSCFHRWGQ